MVRRTVKMKTEQQTEAEWDLMRHDHMIDSIASMNAQQLQAISWFLWHPTLGPDAWTVAKIVKKLTTERAPLHEKVVNERRAASAPNDPSSATRPAESNK